MQKARFIGSEIYRGSSYGPWHPLRVPRVSTVMDLSRALGWLPEDRFVTSPMAKPKALHAFHTDAYIAALQEVEAEQEVPDEVRARHHLGTPSNPIFAEMYRRPATSVGAALLAGELLRDGGEVYAPGCGTHHGMPDRANGFCFLNDPVFAIQSMQRNGATRVAYVDVDAHHPDGVEAAFAQDPSVLLISIHEEDRWPRTGALSDQGVGNVFNMPVPRGFNDSEMRACLERLILPRLEAFQPDALVLQCGADAIREDPQSRLEMSNQALFEVVRRLRGLSKRFMVLGGGGYNPWSVARAWTGIWGILSDQELPDVLPEAASGVLSALEWSGQRRVKEPPDRWVRTLVDDPRDGPIRDEVVERLDTLSQRPLPQVMV